MPTFLSPVAITTASNYLRAGTNPAGSGSVRLPNGIAGAVTFRNNANSNDLTALYATSDDAVWVNGGANVFLATGGAAAAWISSTGLTMVPGYNINTYGNGFKIGSSSGEKVALWGATPITQPANTVAVDDLLVSTGLRASGGVGNFTSKITTASTLETGLGIYIGGAPVNATRQLGLARNYTHAELAANHIGASLASFTAPTSNVTSYTGTVATTIGHTVPSGVTLSDIDGSLYALAATVGKYGPGTVTGTRGIAIGYHIVNDGTVTTLTSLGINDIRCTGTGTVTTAYGIDIAPQLNTGVTTGYGIRQQGASDLNLFNGKIGLGVIPANGRLNLPSGTTAADGLYWGTDTTLYRLATNSLKTDGTFTATALVPGGLTGATAASRLVGGTTSGAPTSGTFSVGDTVIDRTGRIWINTTAGSPGTWTNAGDSGGFWSDAKWGVD